MRNYIQTGNVLTFTAAAAVSAGDPVFQNALFGVAGTDAALGENFEAAVVGVFDLPKAAVAINAGERIYWDSGAGNLTNVSTGNTLVGAATEAAASGAAVVRVRLNGTV